MRLASSGIAPCHRTDRPPAVPRHVRISGDRDALLAITRPGVNLAIWARSIPETVSTQLADLTDRGFPPLRLVAAAADLRAAIGRHLPYHPAAAWLAEDAADLAMSFAALMPVSAGVARSPRVGLRLEVIAGDACRLFHADRVRQRLVTTYRGPGTQWLTNEDAASLTPGQPAPEEGVRELASGHVAVFRGSGHDGADPRPLVHRSPPHRPGAAPRLFLAVDPAPEP